MKLSKIIVFAISAIIGFVLYTNSDLRPIYVCSTCPRPTHLDTLKKEIVRYGNTNAYKELLDTLSNIHSPEYINYSVIMRNKYHYLPAQTEINKFEKEYGIKL